MNSKDTRPRYKQKILVKRFNPSATVDGFDRSGISQDPTETVATKLRKNLPSQKLLAKSKT
jgi:hypothetical protein